jgi:hypothetical protein
MIIDFHYYANADAAISFFLRYFAIIAADLLRHSFSSLMLSLPPAFFADITFAAWPRRFSPLRR